MDKIILAGIQTLTRWFNPIWLTGPILDKELRVSSRRLRNYLLRFFYLALLTAFVVAVWLAMVVEQRSAAYQISQISQAGIAIIATIIQFQFYATQIIAVIMLSTAISDEIYNRTLGVLMTTPINSFQIVMGKLFSKLLQLILLLAISLPILAVVRVFGGVPWGYIISSLCITLTAVLFSGSLALLFSISPRRAYAVILKTLFVLGFFYLFIPFCVITLCSDLIFTGIANEATLISIFSYVSPVFAMTCNSITAFEQAGGPFANFIWPLHCLFIMLATLMVLAIAIRRVRKVALRSAVGQMNWDRQKKKTRPVNDSNNPNQKKWLSNDSPIRPITGSPLIWMETRQPLIQGSRLSSVIGSAIAVGTLLATYIINFRNGSLEENFSHITYVGIFFFMGVIYCTVHAATSITSEKESRAWPLLLTTTLTDNQILWGKALGGFRRCLPVWLFLFAHLLLFTLIGYIHPLASLHIMMVALWVIIYLTGSGLFFSSRFKHTTTAVVANFSMAVFLWMVLPLSFGLLAEIINERTFFNYFVSANPFIQMEVIMESGSGVSHAHRELSRLVFNWPHSHWRSAGDTTLFILINFVLYSLFGIGLALLSKRYFRKNVFNQ